ncbi:MAG: TspO/MBR family protein [Bacillota bacterium]
MKQFKTLISFAIALAYVFVVGYASTLLTTPDSNWYLALAKPDYMPPNYVFPIAWGLCYAFMAIAITATVTKKALRRALLVWGVLGILNILWCLAFFTLHLTYFSLLVLALQVAVVIILTTFYIKHTKYLWITMIPLLAWYIYALLLNFGILILN